MIEIISNHRTIDFVTQRGVIEFVAGGPRGPIGPPGESVATLSASGVVPPNEAATIWVLSTNLVFNPAGLRFWNEDGEEMYPLTTEYVALGVVLVTWLVARSGSWQAS